MQRWPPFGRLSAKSCSKFLVNVTLKLTNSVQIYGKSEDLVSITIIDLHCRQYKLFDLLVTALQGLSVWSVTHYDVSDCDTHTDEEHSGHSGHSEHSGGDREPDSTLTDQ